MPRPDRLALRGLLAAGALAASATLAHAGPPFICQPFETGGAASLPWSAGPGWKTPDPRYDVSRLTADTFAILQPDAPVLLRMETLRRATIYAAGNERAAAELLAAVLNRAEAAQASAKPDPLAMFDAGYLIEAYRQAGHVYHWDMLSAKEKAAWFLRAGPKHSGYTWIERALRAAGTQPEMSYAASLIATGPRARAHLRDAIAGARPGTLLARQLVAAGVVKREADLVAVR